MRLTVSRLIVDPKTPLMVEVEELIAEARRRGADKTATFHSFEDSLAGLFGYTVEWFK
jgi:hypothetical protein